MKTFNQWLSITHATTLFSFDVLITEHLSRLNCRIFSWLCSSVNWTEKNEQDLTKEIWYHCKYSRIMETVKRKTLIRNNLQWISRKLSRRIISYPISVYHKNVQYVRDIMASRVSSICFYDYSYWPLYCRTTLCNKRNYFEDVSYASVWYETLYFCYLVRTNDVTHSRKSVSVGKIETQVLNDLC